MRIDLHVHSNVSDGTESPTRLVFAAQEAGLDVIGLCDHDTFDGLARLGEAVERVVVAEPNHVQAGLLCGEHQPGGAFGAVGDIRVDVQVDAHADIQSSTRPAAHITPHHGP